MRQEFKNRLLILGQNRARQSNFIFTTEALSNLRGLIEIGVNRMTDEELESQQYKLRAENNLLRWVEKMIENSKERNLNESLDTRTFSNARMSICPLWPFC